MTRLRLGLLLGLLLAPATAAAQHYSGLPAMNRQIQREQQERSDRWTQQFQAAQHLTELRLLRMSIDQQTQELQQQHQRELRRRLWEDE